MNHLSYVKHFDGTMYELVETIGNLRYDALDTFLTLLSQKLIIDSIADKERGRPFLSKKLQEASRCIHDAQKEIEQAWRVSEPHMETHKVKDI